MIGQKNTKCRISLLIYKKEACKPLMQMVFWKVAGSGWLPDK